MSVIRGGAKGVRLSATRQVQGGGVGPGVGWGQGWGLQLKDVEIPSNYLCGHC